MKNIMIFVCGVTVIAWAANYIASVVGAGDPAIFSAGMSIGAFGPLIMTVILRKWTGQGWGDAGLRPKFSDGKRWYAFSVLYTPAVITLIAVLAISLGVAEMTPDHRAAAQSMLTTFGIMLGPMLFLSIGEEFGWRGYLEPALMSVNQRVILNHVFVGVVWGLWHFPLLLFAPDSQTNALELFMVVLGCIALAIIYGQMRLRSDSVWPCVIFHAVSNAALISVGSAKLIDFNADITKLISFNSTSAAIIGIWFVTVLILPGAIKTVTAAPGPSGDYSR